MTTGNPSTLSINAFLQIFATKMPYLHIFATKMPYLHIFATKMPYLQIFAIKMPNLLVTKIFSVDSQSVLPIASLSYR